MQRARYLFKFKQLLDQHKEEIAQICTSEHGKTLQEARNDTGRGIENVEHACGAPNLMLGQMLEDVATGIDCVSVRQPLGVFAAITPFNFPPMVPLWFLPYAIAYGNTFVLKPSELVPLSQRRIFELLHETGLPQPSFARLVTIVGLLDRAFGLPVGLGLQTQSFLHQVLDRPNRELVADCALGQRLLV